MDTITFETKCYENDWEFLLQTPYLDQMIQRCNTVFQHKQLIINNVNDLPLVCKFADKKIRKGVIDAYYVAENYAQEALDFFQIDKNSFGKGYYYSIAELVGIYLSKTTYHLHFSSDARMEKAPSTDWIFQTNATWLKTTYSNNPFIMNIMKSPADILYMVENYLKKESIAL